MEPERNKKPRPPLDQEKLERLALHYVGRYATTRAKLKLYLARKVKERGWDGERPADIAALASRLSELRYVDDAAFAAARSSSLQRRGFGERRIRQALRHAGIEEAEAAEAGELGDEQAMEAAIRFARRKRIGPFAPEAPGRDGRNKAFAAMMRAGHPLDVVREVLNALPGDIPDSDSI